MPRSKRSRLLTLAQTDKKGRENKERLFDEIRESLDTFKFVWIFHLDDVRTPVLQQIRQDWVGSKLILGKKRVLEKSLGDNIQEEYKENLSKFAKFIEGVSGLLFTNEDIDTVIQYFESYTKSDYSRAKTRSPISFTIPQGIIYSRGGQIAEDEDVAMSHSLEETLRNKFKIPTKIKSGKIWLDEPYHVVDQGEKLDIRKALILKQFGIAASEFKVKVKAYYNVETSNYKVVNINIEQEEED
ncbi:hypothetical protein WICMUC_005551 [Wickerhamomyces mucosus]|uniref:Ribosome assembly factor mrt4 n=1 Tax=Wickerhamomyces mucosus TaxID=1378264 RepID=A0A9P8P7A4_9ASCO|nr:hypothetical protein WICMUC_005551 [Wickerhamomyces mucosus]